MSWIVWIIWFAILSSILLFFENRSWRRRQTRHAKTRPDLLENEFTAELENAGVSAPVSVAVFHELQGYRGKNKGLNPADPIFGFLIEDGEEMEDIIESLFDKLGLPQPARYEPEITPHLERIGDLAIYLQSRISKGRA